MQKKKPPIIDKILGIDIIDEIIYNIITFTYALYEPPQQCLSKDPLDNNNNKNLNYSGFSRFFNF